MRDPATKRGAEAEALATAVAYLRACREINWLGAPSPLGVSNLAPEHPLGELENLGFEKLKAMAESGDLEADLELRQRLIRETQSAEHHNLLGRLILTAPPLHPRRRGHPSEKDRDIILAQAVLRVMVHGFKATRNKASNSPSACSIVVEALGQIGMPLSEGIVVAAWEKYRTHAEQTAIIIVQNK